MSGEMDAERTTPEGRQVTVLPDGLRCWRKERGLTQDGLETASGVSASLIALIESRRRQPSLPNALAIARALDVPLTAFAVVHVNLAGLDETVPAEVA